MQSEDILKLKFQVIQSKHTIYDKPCAERPEYAKDIYQNSNTIQITVTACIPNLLLCVIIFHILHK